MMLDWPDSVPFYVRVDREKLTDEILILERKIDYSNGVGSTRTRINTWLDRRNLTHSLLEVDNKVLVDLKGAMEAVLKDLKPCSSPHDRSWYLDRVAILRDQLDELRGESHGTFYVSKWKAVFAPSHFFTNGLPLRHLMALSDALEEQMGEAFTEPEISARAPRSKAPAIAQGRKTAMVALPLGDW